MAPAAANNLHRESKVKEIHIVWMTTGLGCDGDSVSITAATQPSLEDVVMGAIPGLAQSPSAQSGAGLRGGRRLHEVLVHGRARRTRSLRAGAGRLDSQRKDQEGRLLGRDGHQPRDRPAHHHQRMDRPAGP